jgi:dihydrofolate synthase/folylpolyglutamate synthase
MSELDRLWQDLCARTDYEKCAKPRAARFRLDTIRGLCARLGNPQWAVPAVHVAGSKGKGTVCHYLARGLQASGQRVGLYTSPHLSTWRERIMIDGDFAADDHLISGMRQVLEASDGSETFFDLLTALAFVVFRDAGCTAQVIETGLGGRFDSTNVLQALASIVVTVEKEHTDVLGEDLAGIAKEKAGIFHEHGLLWAGPDLASEVEAVLLERAQEVEQHLHRGGSEEDKSQRPLAESMQHPMKHVREDFYLAVDVLHALNSTFPGSALALQSLPAAALVLPGRLELRHLPDGRPVLFDVAHTEVSLPPVLEAFRTQSKAPSAVLFALRDDKDAAALAKTLAEHGPRPTGESWFVMPAGDHPRSADPDTIALYFDAEALPEVAFPDGPECFLVTGSTYLVGALRPLTDEPRP